jgi:hypothetical protein
MCSAPGVNIDRAILQFPNGNHIGWRFIRGLRQGYAAGITDVAGQGHMITAQIGYCPFGTHPSTSGWQWSPASFNTAGGNDYEYFGSIAVATPGQYHYAYRFSGNGSVTYADLNGTQNGYTTDQAGVLAVNP